MAERKLGMQGERAVANDGQFSMTVLGTDGSYPGPGGACSGYLFAPRALPRGWTPVRGP